MYGPAPQRKALIALFTHVLAVAPVSDVESAVAWYERFPGRPADARPMAGPADWHIAPSGRLQVFQDAERAGASLVNLVVDDLDQALSDSPAVASPPGRSGRVGGTCGSPPSTTPTATA
ncbi:VOC family protein [Streptomyces sp. NPDC059459]|uniref:VOC family protein n=1 Tax=unclassified Streptomyces TaxID=2593676 RepID=UPI00367C8CBB